MKIIKMNKKIKISLIALIIAVLLVSGEIFAWFYLQNKISLGNLDIGVIPSSDSNGSISVTVNGKPSDESNLEMFSPGNKVNIQIEIENTTTTKNKYKINLSKIGVKYSGKEEYSSKIIYSDSYFAIDNDEKSNYDISSFSLNEARSFFCNFVEPMYNAFYYKYYYLTEPHEYVSLIDNKVKTDEDDFDKTDYIYTETKKYFQIEQEDLGNGIVINDGYIFLPAGEKIVLNFIIYFDESYYPEYNSEDQKQYIMENSNVFVKQKVHMFFDFESIVDID